MGVGELIAIVVSGISRASPAVELLAAFVAALAGAATCGAAEAVFRGRKVIDSKEKKTTRAANMDRFGMESSSGLSAEENPILMEMERWRHAASFEKWSVRENGELFEDFCSDHYRHRNES